MFQAFVAQSRRGFIMAALVCFVAGLWALPVEAAKGKRGVAPVNKLEGILVNKTAASVTIRLQNNTLRVVAVTAATKIERNDVHTTLAAFKIGDRVQALLAANGTATKVEATGL